MEFDMNKFNSRLKALMKSHDMSENDLAKKIGVSNVTICRYLNKERIPHVDIVVKIANYFHVSIEYLFGLTKDMTIVLDSGNDDVELHACVKSLFSLRPNYHFTESQMALIKRILLANKDFILSTY